MNQGSLPQQLTPSHCLSHLPQGGPSGPSRRNGYCYVCIAESEAFQGSSLSTPSLAVRGFWVFVPSVRLKPFALLTCYGDVTGLFLWGWPWGPVCCVSTLGCWHWREDLCGAKASLTEVSRIQLGSMRWGAVAGKLGSVLCAHPLPSLLSPRGSPW